MSSCAKVSMGMIPFGVLAHQVFSLHPAIEWLALQEACCEARWAWRDSGTGRLCAGTAMKNGQVVDPLLLMLAAGCDDLDSELPVVSPHRMLFVVLAYADTTRIVARVRADAHITVAVSPAIDPYVLGTKLTSLLDGYRHPPALN